MKAHVDGDRQLTRQQCNYSRTDEPHSSPANNSLYFSPFHHLRFAPPFSSPYIYAIYSHHVYIYTYILSLLIIFQLPLLAYLLTFLYHILVSSSLSFIFVLYRLQTSNDPPPSLAILPPSDTPLVLWSCFVRVFLFCFPWSRKLARKVCSRSMVFGSGKK